MTAIAQKCSTRKKRRPANESYGQSHRAPRCRKEPTVDRARQPRIFTQAAKELSYTLKMAEMERELARLKSKLKRLLDEAEEKQAEKLLAELTPSNAKLKLWYDQAVPPDDLASSVEDKPW